MTAEGSDRTRIFDRRITALWPYISTRAGDDSAAYAAYRVEVDRLRRVRAPAVYALLIMLAAVTTFLELIEFPDRHLASLLAYAAFCLICAATGVLLRRTALDTGGVIVLSNNLLVLCLLTYYVVVRGDAEVCALTLVLLMTGFVVLDLTDARTQAASSLGAALGFPVTLHAGVVTHIPVLYNVAAVAGGGLVTTAGALLLDRQRAAAAQQRERIRASEENLRGIFEHLRDIFFRVDQRGIIRMVSPSVARLGYRPEELIGADTRTFVDSAGERQRINTLLIATTPTGEFELLLPARDGTQVPVSVNAQVMTDDEGRFAGIVGILRDISERKRVEDRLRESEERYRRLYEDNPAMYFTVDANGTVLSVNQFGAEQLGYTPQELIGAPVMQVVFPADREAVRAQLERCLTRLNETVHWEFRKVRRDGSVFWVRETARAVQSSDGRAVVLIVCEDITALKRAEEAAHQHRAELAHVLRLSTMGEMAAGLAHEINQPLAAIVNYTRGAQRRLRAGTMETPTLLDTLEEISILGLRAGEIVRRMRDFVRKQAPTYDWVDLNALVRDVGALTEPEARQHGVGIAYDFAHDLPAVCVDRIQIEQVVVNLMRNALEAMEGTDASERALTATTRVAGPDAVEVAISDTGTGLSAGQLEQAFEPFFTTKRNGLGLGLGISRSIIEAHGGRLWATPHSPRGTTFRFQLQRHPAQAAGPTPAPASEVGTRPSERR